jgi:hypothetical protein
MIVRARTGRVARAVPLLRRPAKWVLRLLASTGRSESGLELGTACVSSAGSRTVSPPGTRQFLSHLHHALACSLIVQVR